MSPRAQSGPLASLARDRIDAALEASCEALFALQLIRARARDDAALERRTSRAIELLSRAITELRLARCERLSPLGHGFVLAAPLDRLPGLSGRGQSKPRRTA